MLTIKREEAIVDFVSEQMMRRVTILYDEKSDHFVFERMIETEEWSFCI